MSEKRVIARSDVLTMDDYAARRTDLKKDIAAYKVNRRVEVGPFATFYFESYKTMWHQVHEMLFIEKGGEEQIADELEAYNPLIPKGSELVATVMFEIDDPDRRARVLAGLGGVEHTMSIRIGDETIMGHAEEDVDRTNAAGKASSIQFVHFNFTPAQIEAFTTPGTETVLAIGHQNYGHMAIIPEPVRAALSEDFA